MQQICNRPLPGNTENLWPCELKQIPLRNNKFHFANFASVKVVFCFAMTDIAIKIKQSNLNRITENSF